MENGIIIAEKAEVRKKSDRAHVSRLTAERELASGELLPWAVPVTQRRRDTLGETWAVQLSGEGEVRPAFHPVRIEIVIDPSQARSLIALLRYIFARLPEATAPSDVGQGCSLPTRRAFDLTPREDEVLEQMIDGKSNRQIALDLEIAPATVKSHVSNILSKMGAQSRAKAVAMALQHQLSAERT